jgi:hypothetical protein
MTELPALGKSVKAPNLGKHGIRAILQILAREPAAVSPRITVCPYIAIRFLLTECLVEPP